MKIKIAVKKVAWGTVELDVDDIEDVESISQYDLRRKAEKNIESFDVCPDTVEVIEVDKNSVEV